MQPTIADTRADKGIAPDTWAALRAQADEALQDAQALVATLNRTGVTLSDVRTAVTMLNGATALVQHAMRQNETQVMRVLLARTA